VWLIGLVTTAVACGTTWVVTPPLVKLARRVGAIDHPGPRKIHADPIPRIGGLAIFLGFAAGLTFAAFATGYAVHPPGRVGYWSVLGAAAVVMLALGLVDDVRSVGFQTKFAVQVLCATAVWWAGFRVESLGIPFVAGNIDVGIFSLPVTILWVVGITNAFNLIDGLDGLAAGTALITTSTIAIISLYGGRIAVSAISVALVGALMGFLRYNFNPAQIFLGDSGSMFLGFSLAVVSIHGSQKNVTAVAVIAPLLIMGYPILDTSVAIARRLHAIRTQSPGGGMIYLARNAYRVFLPDRGHLHHRLLDLGLSQRSAVVSIYGVALALAAAALALVFTNSVKVAIILAAMLTLSTLGFLAVVLARTRVVRRRERDLRDDTPPSQTRPAASGEALGRG